MATLPSSEGDEYSLSSAGKTDALLSPNVLK